MSKMKQLEKKCLDLFIDSGNAHGFWELVKDDFPEGYGYEEFVQVLKDEFGLDIVAYHRGRPVTWLAGKLQRKGWALKEEEEKLRKEGVVG